VVLEPFHLLTGDLTGTTHGSPHRYDTHVPLLVFGTGIRAGDRREEVSPLAVAAILSASLGIRPPPDAEASLPEALFATAP
jgi:hypothetical protein